MHLVQHRVNSVEELKNLPPSLGAEIDLRTDGGEIVLHHDPFKKGDLFKSYLEEWARQDRKGLLILNTKEDGLENAAIQWLETFRISSYFFLDTALPTLVRRTQSQPSSDACVRFSEYEPLSSVKLFENRCQWVWIDSFEGRPYPVETLKNLNQQFRTCLVSPELQGYPKERIKDFFSNSRILHSRVHKVSSGVVPVKTVVLTENQKLKIENRKQPQAKPGECLVKVKSAGVCSSDIYRGFEGGAYHYPLVMGHELAGEIVEVGEGWSHSQAGVGSRVVVFPLLPCHSCDQCQLKEYARCRNYDYFGSRRDGGFCEFLQVPQWNVLKIPESLDFSKASLVEPVSVVVHALKRATHYANPQRVCVLGAGFLGLVATELLQSVFTKEAHISLADRNVYKLDKIKSNQIQKFLLNSNQEKESFLQDHKASFDFVLEAAGVPETFHQSIELAAPGGTVMWLGNISDRLDLSQREVSSILRKELQILGTWNSSYDPVNKSDWSDTLDLLSGEVDIEPFITQKISLDELPLTIEKLHRHKTRKEEFKSIKVIVSSQSEGSSHDH